MVKMRLGLLGGTFNPVHQGHIQAAQVVQKSFDLNKVYFIPAYIPPHKSSQAIASPKHRLRMVELAVEPFPDFIPSSIEIEAGGKSYSIITLGKFQQLFPGSSIYFILGIDAFLEIDTWKDYERLLEQCDFIVLSRPGYDLSDAKTVLGGRFKKKIIDVNRYINRKQTRKGYYKIILFPFDGLDLSSTEIREKVNRGKSIKGLVPEEVEAYIKKYNLYQ
ncbi:MAG: nicotinate-nucleotide adenylyltransferase [Candidatus Aminicenantes bacterium]|nr:nicotinate-nucleotide adenylyltransferase [Candidatus Aminicenantes bacterium]